MSLEKTRGNASTMAQSKPFGARGDDFLTKVARFVRLEGTTSAVEEAVKGNFEGPHGPVNGGQRISRRELSVKDFSVADGSIEMPSPD